MFNLFKKRDNNAPKVFCKDCKHCVKYDDLRKVVKADRFSDWEYVLKIPYDYLCNKFIKYEKFKEIDYYSSYEYDAIVKVGYCETINKRNDCEFFEHK